MAYWALEALDGSKTALSSLDRVEGTDPPAYKIGRRPHEESHFGTLPICVSRNQAQLTPCHDGVAIRHSGSAPTGVLRHHGARSGAAVLRAAAPLLPLSPASPQVLLPRDLARLLGRRRRLSLGLLASRTLIKKISDAALLSGESMLATVSHLALLFDAS